MAKEEEFFDKAEKTVLSKEEEQEMFEQFQSVTAITKKIEEIIKQIDYLENQSWMKGQVVSSGFNVQATARIIKGTDIIAVI